MLLEGNAKKNLFGDGFEEGLKARSETAKTLFQAANAGHKTTFFRGRTTPFRSRGYRGGGPFRCSTEPIQPRLPPPRRVLGQGPLTQHHPQTATLKQVSTHLIPNTAGLKLNLKHLDLTHLPLVGRLKHCLKYWQLICKDRWVLQAIEGYQIDFTSLPFQSRYPQGIVHTQVKSNLIENEVQDLLTKRPSTQFQWGKNKMDLSATCFLSPKNGVVRDR